MKEGKRLKRLREEQGFSLREVARRSGVSPANLSLIENGHISPTLASLRKVLESLGCTFAEFFGAIQPIKEPVFYRKDMKSIEDNQRKSTFLLPRRREIKIELLFEEVKPQVSPEMEIFNFDVAICLFEGGPLELEIEGEGTWEVNPGDACYIPAGHKHRAVNKGKKLAKVYTCCYPPRY